MKKQKTQQGSAKKPLSKTSKKIAVKKTSAKKKVNLKKTSSKISKTEPAKYFKIDGKNVRIPKLISGHHKKVIEMFFTLPVDFRKNLKQVFTKATDEITFGPMKGKQLRELLKKGDDTMRQYYRKKVFGAFKQESLAFRVSDFFMDNKSLKNHSLIPHAETSFVDEVYGHTDLVQEEKK